MSRAQIFDAVKQLPPNELEDFVNQILVLRAKKRFSALSDTETKILKNIYRKFSVEKLARLRSLKAKLEEADLSKNEYAELAALSDSLEEFHARRIKNLVKLSKIRGLELEETMAQLGIKFPDYE